MNSFENTPAVNYSAENKPEVRTLPKPVYYIESPDDSDVLVGIDVTINSTNIGAKRLIEISWFDTAKQRSMTATETNSNGDYFAFKRIEEEGGGTYYFAPMDMITYHGKVREHLSNAPIYNKYEDMIKGLLDSKNNAY